MRTLVEMSKDREVELIDGVRVRHDDGWALAAARPGGARHARVGGGRHRRRGQGAGQGVRPSHPPAAAVAAGPSTLDHSSRVRAFL